MANGGTTPGVGATTPLSITPNAPMSADKIIETFQFTLVLDAADTRQSASSDSLAHGEGLHPMLAALELLLREDAKLGPDVATVFVWGTGRRLPVRLVGLAVHEQLFDASLNPIRATVDVTLQALDGSVPGTGELVGQLFAEHQSALQALASPVYTSTESV